MDVIRGGVNKSSEYDYPSQAGVELASDFKNHKAIYHYCFCPYISSHFLTNIPENEELNRLPMAHLDWGY